MTTTNRPTIVRAGLRRRWHRMAGLALTAAVLACSNDDPFRSPATFQNTVVGVAATAFSAGTLGPSALDLLSLQLVRPQILAGGSANFQLALDVRTSGQALLLPVLALLNPPTGSGSIASDLERSVSIGLQRSTATFDNAARAPTTGFVYDSITTATVGDTYLVELRTSSCPFGNSFYGKLQIESVSVAERRIVARFLVNRNCGYRDLTVGLPTN